MLKKSNCLHAELRMSFNYLKNLYVQTYNAWNLPYDRILYIFSYFRCYNQKVQL